MSAKGSLAVLLDRLASGQVALIVEMAQALLQPISQSVNPKSDLLTPGLVEDFTNRLKLHHATHEDKFTKKSFEYALCAAARADNKEASIVSVQTNPGSDIIISGVHYSLKTEAAKGARQRSITISKLMEARWIRECATPKDFCMEAKLHILKHLRQYSRILVLRCFDTIDGAVKYSLVEIPLKLLMTMENLRSEDFSPKTKRGGGSSADVLDKGKYLFTLRLDGSVEKVTINNLSIDYCFTHGEWAIPVAVRFKNHIAKASCLP